MTYILQIFSDPKGFLDQQLSAEYRDAVFIPVYQSQQYFNTSMFQIKILSLHFNKYFRNITFYEYFRTDKDTNFSCAWSINDKEKKFYNFYISGMHFLTFYNCNHTYSIPHRLILVRTVSISLFTSLPPLCCIHIIFFISYR